MITQGKQCRAAVADSTVEVILATGRQGSSRLRRLMAWDPVQQLRRRWGERLITFPVLATSLFGDIAAALREDGSAALDDDEPKHGGWHMGALVGTKIAGEALGARGRVCSFSSAGPSRRGVGANNGAVLPAVASSAPMRCQA